MIEVYDEEYKGVNQIKKREDKRWENKSRKVGRKVGKRPWGKKSGWWIVSKVKGLMGVNRGRKSRRNSSKIWFNSPDYDRRSTCFPAVYELVDRKSSGIIY